MAKVKICGLRDVETIEYAASQGADWIGFALAPSPRRVSFSEARALIPHVGPSVPVGFLVNPSDDEVSAAADTGLSILQLHGEESPARVAEIRARTGLAVWKVIKVREPIHLVQTQNFAVADGYLIDARPPDGAAQAGGHGESFDWRILDGWTSDKPWLLAGGLTPENVAAAIALTGATAVDVSSGVERSRGVKDMSLIRAFLRAAKES